MLTLIRNASLFAPEKLGQKDMLICFGKIVSVEDKIESFPGVKNVINAQGKTVTPGFIDQHIHITGAGGKYGFASMTPEIMLSELVACGSTTVMGLLGTDGTTRSIKTLYAKAKALTDEGISAYMLTSYFGIDPVTITGSIQDDMMFVDKVLGCKVAISDERSDFPTAHELLKHLRAVTVGGMIAGKKGILHLHLGLLDSRIDVLMELVKDFQYPIQHISPTHVTKSKDLFDQSIEFAKLGGMIDITTGGTKYTDPYKSVIYALDQGVSIDLLTFSSDGNAGLAKKDENGKMIGFKKAPIDLNYKQLQALVKEGGLPLQDALKLITINPANNLGLKNKGRIQTGADADLCFFDEDLKLSDVMAKGVMMMEDYTVNIKGNFE